jgi:hypothetical protein
MHQRAKQLRPRVLSVRAKIPWIFGDNTYVYAAIAASGGVLRESDIHSSLGHAAVNSLHKPDREALGILRRFRIQTVQSSGPRGFAVCFDETFPLTKEARALARKIGVCHSPPIDNKMPKETPPPPTSRNYNVDLIAGSEVNTLVLATTRALRGNASLSELAAAVPHGSLTAVKRAISRLRDYGILDADKDGGVYFKKAPWRSLIERLYDEYLRLRPDLQAKARERAKIKRQRRERRAAQNLFGYAVKERALKALALHGPMRRTELASVATIARDEIVFKTLIKAGILAVEEQVGKKGKGSKAHGTRKRVVVSLNAAFPVYRELRALLLSFAEGDAKKVRDLSHPRKHYDISAIFNTPTLLKALLLMNAVNERELDVASLNRLRPEHAVFTLHGRIALASE